MDNKIDTKRKFLCNSGTELLNGKLKIQLNETVIQRKDNLIYLINGKTISNLPFKIEFECKDDTESNKLYKELLEKCNLDIH